MTSLVKHQILAAVSVVCAAITVGSLICGAAAPDVADQVTARRLVVVDGQGRTVFEVGTEGSDVGWVIRDPQSGTAGVAAYVSAAGARGLNIQGTDGKVAVRAVGLPDSRGGLLSVYGSDGVDLFSVKQPNSNAVPLTAHRGGYKAMEASGPAPESTGAERVSPIVVNGVQQ